MKNRAQRIVARLAGDSSPATPLVHLVRFVDPSGLEQTLAMAPGDAVGFGGVRVDVTADRELTVTPWTPEPEQQD